MTSAGERIFSWRQILIYLVGSLGFVFVAQRILRYVAEHLLTIDNPFYWPISVFSPRFPSGTGFVIAIAVFAAFLLIYRQLEARKFDLRIAGLSGIFLIGGLTMIHGIDIGFYAPISGDAQTGTLIANTVNGQEYYHEAIKIADPVDFVRRYNEIQATLSRHSHTHPPGAVLTFYLLNKVFRDPAIIGIFIMIVSAFASLFFVYKIARSQMEEETARFIAFIFLLLPVVQIYYLASLDALITAMVIGTLYFFCFGERNRSIVAASVLLTASFLLTFVSLFILPVLFAYEVLIKRSVRRTMIVFGSVVAFHFILYFVTGYSAFESFRTASHFENPNGFMLFVDPWNYLFTRIEDIAEIALFFGPFLAIIFWRGMRRTVSFVDYRSRPLILLTVLGCATLLAMFAVGTWRTGETARAGAFIFAFLLMPVGLYLDEIKSSSTARMQLAALVFAQSLGMQLFGNYFW